MTSALRIVSVLPGLLGTYGDAGNEIALIHRMRTRGLPVECVHVEPGEPVPVTGDIYLIGGGEDRAQALAVALIGEALGRAVEQGATVLGVCAGLQILGETFTDSSGATYRGLGLLDVVSESLPARAVGEVSVMCGLPGVGRVVGFENHQGGSRLGPSAQPFAVIESGVGNGLTAGAEGAIAGRVVGTYLHGPVLALNPLLADYLLAWTVGTLLPIDDARAHRARAIRGA
jgi:CobQ-like glutamine amidotransferase family enzyme